MWLNWLYGEVLYHVDEGRTGGGLAVEVRVLGGDWSSGGGVVVEEARRHSHATHVPFQHCIPASTQGTTCSNFKLCHFESNGSS